MEKTMKFLLVSDMHGNAKAVEELKAQAAQCDGILCAGDFAEFGKAETGEPTLEALLTLSDSIYSVIGNCDEFSFLQKLEEKDISVEKALVQHEGLIIAGSGGGSKFTGTTPFERSDEELVSDFSLITEQGEEAWDNLVAIMHNPPKDTKCDCIEGGIHVGSPLLREFIEKYKPLAVLTGHIHESCGIDRIGNTLVVNPGPLMEGKYGLMTVTNCDGHWSAEAELCSIKV